jgi:hypothetical protein
VSRSPRVLYAGYLVRCPLGGYAWQVVHYVRGLLDAGVDVTFYEDTRHVWEAFDPIARTSGNDYRNGIALAGDIFARAGLADRWIFHDAGRDEYAGAGREAARALFADATVLINAAGVHHFSAAERRGKRNVYIDMDPTYTQIRAAGGDRLLGEILAEHDLHFTFGENIGRPGSRIPAAGIEWRPTRQPIALDFWRETPPDPHQPFTTIGTWDSRGRDVELDGERYSWRKRDEWQAIMGLPQRSGAPFALAMEVRDPAERAELTRAGWEVRDPIDISSDPLRYQRFIASSLGEFTTAKDVNVRLTSGWFSDRSACYLAAGRPVVTQDTGFGDNLPTGEGLFAYRTLEEATEAVRSIRADPERQGRAARRIAEQCFDARTVIRDLLEPI